MLASHRSTLPCVDTNRSVCSVAAWLTDAATPSELPASTLNLLLDDRELMPHNASQQMYVIEIGDFV